MTTSEKMTFARAERMHDLPRPTLPRVVRMFNKVAASRDQPGLHADELLARAAGTGARFDARVEEGVRVLCASLNAEGTLHAFGKVYARAVIGSALRVRARVDRLFAARPELAQVPLRRPLVIFGFPRSGTTFLHRLLAEGDNARSLAQWELIQPIAPDRGPDVRRVRAWLTFHAFRRAAPPALDAMHFMRPSLPDECQLLFRLDMRAPMLWLGFAALSYADWLFQEDMGPSCALYRRLLQYFQAQNPDARLVLKNPDHALHADALMAALPEALFVQTHRDPLATLPSNCLLTLILQNSMTDGTAPNRVVDTVVRRQLLMAQRSLTVRESTDGQRIFDLPYDELVSDPVGAAQRIHEHFDLPWNPALRARIVSHTRRNRQYRHGRYKYSLEQFGLHREQLAEAFAGYTQRFLEA